MTDIYETWLDENQDGKEKIKFKLFPNRETIRPVADSASFQTLPPISQKSAKKEMVRNESRMVGVYEN